MASRIKTDDVVVVIAGRDKGKRGRVLRLVPNQDRVVVEGCNRVTRHKKANPQNPATGGRIEMEAPIHISNVMPWSDKDSKGVRVRFETRNDRKVRIAVTSGEELVTGAAPAATVAEKTDKKKQDDGE